MEIHTQHSLLEHAQFVSRLARGLLRDPTEAADVAQDAVLIALRQPPRHQRELKGWFNQIVRRLVHRRYRSDQRRGHREAVAAHAMEVAADESAPDRVLARQELLSRMTAAVLGLPEVYRDVVLLHYYEGRSLADIARSTRTPQATMHSRLRRALGHLRARLDRDAEGDRRAWMSALIPMAGRLDAAVAAGVPIAAMIGGVTVGTKVQLATIVTLAGLAVGLWRFSGPPPRSEPEPSLVRSVAERETPRLDPQPVVPITVVAPDEERVVALPGSGPQLADPRSGALEITVRHARDGSPAGDASLRLIAWAAPAGGVERTLRTDPAGVAFVDRVHPGSVAIEVGGGGEVAAEVLAGEVTRVLLQIPPGICVTGRVLDPAGRLVAGADLWVSEYGNHEAGQIVGQSDALGRFRLNDIGEGRTIAALAAGFAPSLQCDIAPPAGTPDGGRVDLDLQLSGPGYAMTGSVWRPDGSPAAGARVRLVPPRPRPVRNGATIRVVYLPPSVALVAADGTFAFAGVPAGTATLSVRDPGSAPIEESLEFADQPVLDYRIQLQAAAAVVGRVLAGGAPVRGADVHLAADYDIDRPGCESGEDGQFRLTGLPLGEVTLVARHESFGEGTVALRLAAGEEGTAQIVLDSGATVVGHLVDGEGAALGGWIIEVRDDSLSFWGQETTDQAGAFRIRNCPDGLLRLAVKRQVTDAEAVLEIARIQADGRDRRIVYDARQHAAGEIVMRVVDAAGEPLPADLVVWRVGSRFGTTRSATADGVVATGPIMPAGYRLVLQFQDGSQCALGRHELPAGQRLDLGTIRIEPAGTLRIEIVGGAGLGDYDNLSLLPEQDLTALAFFAGDGDELPERIPLLPGRYWLMATGAGVADQRVSVVINAGATTEVTLAPRPGVACSFEVVGDDVDGVGDVAEAELIGPSGRMPLRAWVGMVQGAGLAIEPVTLPPGRYELLVRTDRGRAGSAVFEAQGEHMAVEVSLH